MLLSRILLCPRDGQCLCCVFFLVVDVVSFRGGRSDALPSWPVPRRMLLFLCPSASITGLRRWDVFDKSDKRHRRCCGFEGERDEISGLARVTATETVSPLGEAYSGGFSAPQQFMLLSLPSQRRQLTTNQGTFHVVIICSLSVAAKRTGSVLRRPAS